MPALCNFKWNVGILAPVRPQRPISCCKYHPSVHREPHQTGFSFLLSTAKHNFKNSGGEEWSILSLNPYPFCDSFLILGSFCLKHLFQQILFSKAAGDSLTRFFYIRDVFVSPSSLKSILTGIKLWVYSSLFSALKPFSSGEKSDDCFWWEVYCLWIISLCLLSKFVFSFRNLIMMVWT